MKFTSKLIKRAWKIRKEAAVKWGCKVMEISWKLCLKEAKDIIEIESWDFYEMNLGETSPTNKTDDERENEKIERYHYNWKVTGRCAA